MSRNDTSTVEGKKPEQEAFNYDIILDHIGQMGKYQLRTCLWLSVPAIFSVFGVMSFSFIGAIPQFRYSTFPQLSWFIPYRPIYLLTHSSPSYDRCLVDGCANGTDIPWNNFTSIVDLKDSCYRFNFTVTDPDQHCHPQNISHIESSLLEKCDAWTYDTSIFESTIFTDVTTRFSSIKMSIATYSDAELDPKWKKKNISCCINIWLMDDCF